MNVIINIYVIYNENDKFAPLILVIWRGNETTRRRDMTRDIYLRTKTRVRRYTLGKNGRPLTIVCGGLYRTDEKYMTPSDSEDHEFVMYPKDGTQPYWATEVIDPDLTMAYIDIAKQTSKNAANKINWLNSMNPSWIIYGIVGAVIVYAVAVGGVV